MPCPQISTTHTLSSLLPSNKNSLCQNQAANLLIHPYQSIEKEEKEEKEKEEKEKEENTHQTPDIPPKSPLTNRPTNPLPIHLQSRPGLALDSSLQGLLST
jgi:hypothetical protein